MISTLCNSTIYQSMEAFDELDDPTQFLMREFNPKLDCSFDDYQGLQSKYSSLHETYTKEMENTKKVEKCLVKCLKFYSKLSKKYEVQQKVIGELEENMKEKTRSLEESLKNEEKMRGLIQVYKSERSIYLKESVENLKKDKEILLDICCRLIRESVKNTNTRNLTNLLLRKFRRDLDDEKLNMLKFRDETIKKEVGKYKELDYIKSENLKSLNDSFISKEFSETNRINGESNEIYGDCVPDDEKKLSENKLEQKLELFGNLKKFSLDTLEDCKISKTKFSFKECEEGNMDVKVNSLKTKQYSLPSHEKDEKGDKPFKLDCKNCDMPAINVQSEHSNDEEGNHEFESDLVSLKDNRNSAFHNNSKSVSLCENLEKIDYEFKEGNLVTKEESQSISSEGSERVSVTSLQKTQNFHEEWNESYEFEEHEQNFRMNSNSTKSSSLFLGNIFENECLQNDTDICSKGNNRANFHSPTDKSTSEIPKLEKLKDWPLLDMSKTVISSPNSQYLNERCNGRSIFDILDDQNEIKTHDNYNFCVEKSPCSQPLNIFEIGFDRNLSSSKASANLQLPSNSNEGFSKSLKELTTKQVAAKNETEIFKNKELELCQIFKEMSAVRMVSPIREIDCLSKPGMSNKDKCSNIDSLNLDYQSYLVHELSDFTEKQNLAIKKRQCSTASDSSEETRKNKKLRVEESISIAKNTGPGKNGGLLDSILSAMSIQNEEFRNTVKNKVSPVKEKFDIVASFSNPGLDKTKETKRNFAQNPKETCFVHQTRSNKEKQRVERLLTDELKKFVSSPITSKEEADKNVKHCLSVLMNKPEEMIARIIVGIVFENVDENVEIFERPAPPLTNTQHRVMVLLSVFKTLDPNSEKILSFILDIISEKLFPDNFFWPDDCVEMACRFYTALCKMRNDNKTLWKFCLRAMTEMKQRSCMIVFTALKTWPDVLHNATTLQNNILAVTIVNIFLHMPKSEGLRNHNQKKKLMALKHLLMNFYQFKVDDTIETYTQKVYDKVLKEEMGSNKSLVLLAKCRDWNWTSKHILSKIKETLKDWAQNKVEDAVGIKILSVIKELSVFFFKESRDAISQVKEIIFCLSDIISSRKKSHVSEQTIIEVLLEMKQDPEARKVIQEWVPKNSISEILRNEIINVSAENILRELKLNPKKNSPEKKKYGKQKRKQKKSVGKKKKAKKRKSN